MVVLYIEDRATNFQFYNMTAALFFKTDIER